MAAVSLDAAKEMGRSLGMSDADVEGYKTQFDACDEDGGGTISNDELKTVLRKCGVQVTNVEVERYIKEFDTDGDGVLDFGEFLGMMFKFNQGPSERDTRKAMFEVRGVAPLLLTAAASAGQGKGPHLWPPLLPLPRPPLNAPPPPPLCSPAAPR